MLLAPGETLERRYKIDKKLGEGGFGAVYRAYDTRLNVLCAVKESFDSSEEVARQFKRGAEMLAGLRHPHLPRVTDYFDIPNKGLYLVMDFVQGEDLQTRIQRLRQPLPEDQVVVWLLQICDALTYIHSQNPPIIHRDIKPQNIIIDQNGKAILVDFGLAKLYESSQRTSLGARGLTPGFAALEQYGTGATDARSDIYSLGATAYAMLTAHVPPESIQRVVKAETLTSPHEFIKSISEPLSNAIMQALEIDPRLRPQTALEFLGKFSIEGPEGKVARQRTQLEEVEHPENELTIQLASGVAMEFVRVPAGEFSMGSDPEDYDKSYQNDDLPQRIIFLGEYLIGKYPVTNKQYYTFVQAINHTKPEHWIEGKIPKNKEDHPVVNVSYDDAISFCNWVSKSSGRLVRLPSEAEWEKAARGTDGRIYPWGGKESHSWEDDDPILDDDHCNYAENIGDTTPIGHYSPIGDSPYGCTDMTGNISEWVADWYEKTYFQNSPSNNPIGPASGWFRVQRGGSWKFDMPWCMRVTFRVHENPNNKANDFGFRCAI